MRAQLAVAETSGTPISSRDLHTVDEFLELNGGFSRAFFYVLLKKGLGPRLTKIGKRTFISREAALEWRHAREKASAEGHACG
jgi:hypothetical protein